MGATLIADSGSTKTSWTLTEPGKRKKNITTQGLSPYFLTSEQVNEILKAELHPKLKSNPDDLFFYGTGCGNPANVKMRSPRASPTSCCSPRPVRSAGTKKGWCASSVRARVFVITMERRLPGAARGLGLFWAMKGAGPTSAERLFSIFFIIPLSLT